MNVAEMMIKCLENEGVTHIFGVPGEENEDFMFALEHSGISFINCRHEQGAAFMANVYGRLTGKAGVCLSTLGPGATNLLTGIADAHLDKAPVVAITAQGGLDRIHHESHQLVDIVSMFRPVSKYNISIHDPQITREVVRKAFKLAEEEKPGVTHIELPESIAAHQVKKTEPLPALKPRIPSPDPIAIAQGRNVLLQAKNPLIIAGNGAIRNRASKALTTHACSNNIPVVSTFMGKGAVDMRRDQSLYSIGLNFKDYIIEAAEQADVIVSVGYDIAEYDPKNWNVGIEKKIIHIDFESAEIFEDYIPAVEIIGDIEASLNQLFKNLNQSYSNWYVPFRERISRSIWQYEEPGDSNNFSVPSVVNVINKIMNDDTLVISDVGAHKMWIARNLIAPAPGSCIISNGLASMGIALPGLIGAHIADMKPNKIALMGDGGFLMNVQELETAVRLKVSGCYLVFVNNDYELISWKQERSKGKSFGTEFGNPNFELLAKSFNITSYVPADHDQLKQAILKIWNENELGIVVVPVDSHVNNKITIELDKYFSK